MLIVQCDRLESARTSRSLSTPRPTVINALLTLPGVAGMAIVEPRHSLVILLETMCMGMIGQRFYDSAFPDRSSTAGGDHVLQFGF